MAAGGLPEEGFYPPSTHPAAYPSPPHPSSAANTRSARRVYLTVPSLERRGWQNRGSGERKGFSWTAKAHSESLL